MAIFHMSGIVISRSQMARLEEHQRIARENGEKLFANPEIALTALTRQQSTFTHYDLARFVSRHTLDAEQFQHVFEKVKACVEKDIQSRKPYAKSKLEDYAASVSEKTAVMNYFKTQNPNLSHKIEELTKSHEHAKQWDDGMERGF